MKNLAIEKPSTLIKLKLPGEKIRQNEKTVSVKGIDFYETDDSIIFNGFYDKDESYKNSNNICPFNENINYVKIEDFFLTNLRFDLRIKYYERKQEDFFIYFFSEIDAISFYRQYLKYYEISFQQFCNWSPILSETFFEIEPTILYLKKEKSVIQTPKLDKDIIYNRKRFFETVDYFNNMKSTLSKNDLHNMTVDISSGNTNFVFKNSKELAVGSKSNKIMQEAIKIMSGEEIEKLYDHLDYDIAAISASKHGAYTIQTLLNFSTNLSHKKQISKYFSKEGEFLLAHEIGNYTFQKLVSFDVELVRNFFLLNFEDVIDNDLGLKVFKKCVDILSPVKDEVLNILLQYENIPDGLLVQLKSIIFNL